MSIAAPTAYREQKTPIVALRWMGLDAARLAASLAIVWIHVPRSAALAGTTIAARFAVPFFTCTAIYFAFRRGDRDGGAPAARNRVPRSRVVGLLEYARSRFTRLYLPFLAWSAAYLALKVVKGSVAPEQPNEFGGWEMLWTGSAYHLWFLPFILVASVVAYAIAAATSTRVRWRAAAAAASVVAGATFALSPPPGIMDASEVHCCVWFALPGTCWGMTLAALCPRFRHGKKGTAPICRNGPKGASHKWGLSPFSPPAGITLFLAAMLGLAATGRMSLLENLAGLGLAVSAFSWPADARLERLAPWGALAYGIYCSHLLFIKLCESIFCKLRWPISPGLDLAIFLIAICCSAALARLLASSRRTRWLVA